jgi:hypothetical protein
MINRNENPEPWVLFIVQFQEAHEHLSKLISDITSDRGYDEARLRIDLGHVMAHLNRAWTSRNVARELTDAEWESFREYPQDLRPIA